MDTATSKNQQIYEILKDAKKLAQKYYKLTGKPLGITGEVAECEVASKLKGVTLAGARQEGYDAIRKLRGKKEQLQIKGRRICAGKNSGMVPAINMNKKFDAVLLVLLDEGFGVTGIYEESLENIKKKLAKKPISNARKKGALSVSQFMKNAIKHWPKDQPK